jgi:hypothetical protein
VLTAKTVFVLGAGASAPYGFPTGGALLTSLLGMKRKARENPTLPLSPYECLLDAGFPQSRINGFLNALGDSGRWSVDAFLEHRTEFLEVGKAAMAAGLLPRETHDVLFSQATGSREHWYQYMFNKLNASFDELERNDVAFLTFNYDRSLEYYLTTAIQNTYGKSFAEAAAKVAKLRIIHLYGDLGALEEANAQRWRSQPAWDGAAVKAAASRIHIIHSSDGDKEFAVGRYFLEHAQVICFLGFGYHPINVGRLLKSVSRGKDVVVLGTGHGLGLAERDSAQAAVRNSLPSFEINQQNWTVMQLLRNSFSWW